MLFGAVVFVIGMSVIGWDFVRLDNTEYTAKSFAVQASERVERVEIDVSSFPVEVVGGDAVAVEYYDATNSEVSVGCADGVLSVRERYDFDPFKSGLFNIGRFTHKYKLTLDGGQDHVTVDGGNGSISFEGMTFGELVVKSTNAEISFVSCTVESLVVHSTNIDVTATNSEFGSVTVHGTNVTAEMSGAKCGAMKIDATNLDLTTAGGEISSLIADATNSDVDIKRITCEKIILTATNGDFEIDKVTVHTVSLHATNLDAELHILGNASEYTVRTSGKNMPPRRDGSTDKSIELSGTNNDVTLVFEN